MFAFVFLLVFVLYPLGGDCGVLLEPTDNSGETASHLAHTQSHPESARCPAGFTFIPLAYQCFRIYTQKRVWVNAAYRCGKTNSTLATLKDAMDLLPVRRFSKTIKGKCLNPFSDDDEFWTAGKKIQGYFGWHNGSGVIVDSIPSLPFIPQSVNGPDDLDCLSFQFTDFFNYGFKFSKCGRRQCFLCVFSL